MHRKIRSSMKKEAELREYANVCYCGFVYVPSLPLERLPRYLAHKNPWLRKHARERLEELLRQEAESGKGT